MPERNPSSSAIDAVVVVVVVVAAFALLWWLVGDLSAEGFPADDLDYNFGRLDIDPALETTAGVIALCLFVFAAFVLVTRWRHGAVTSRRLLAVGLYVVGAALSALCLRVMTAGTIGANIGGGMAVLFGSPLIVGLFIVATVLCVRRPTAGHPTP